MSNSNGSWRPGDRVQVQLPDKLGLSGRRHAMTWVPGVVTALDDRGVTVAFDAPFNGVPDCHALRRELVPA